MKYATTLLPLLTVATMTRAAGPATPETPAKVNDVVYVERFKLDHAYRSHWRVERPEVREGVILVLAVDPDLVYPRQLEEPVLYVGAETAERWNVGYRSGHVIATVQGDVVFGDTLIWFGSPAYPEQVDAEKAASEKSVAKAKGIEPIAAERFEAAAAEKGATVLSLKNRDELANHIAELVRRFSPQEKDLADGLAMNAVRPE
jgi:hypothetical protein